MKSKLKNSAITKLPLPNGIIHRKIYLIRGQKVMLDSDLAGLYQIETKSLKRAVKRNLNRFPADFMFKLTKEEYKNLRYQIGTSSLTSQIAMSSIRSQFVTGSTKYGGNRYLAYAFTEHGVAMLSSVLNSQRAVQMNILIIRAFIKIRQLSAANSALEKRLDKVEDLQKLHHKVIIAMTEDINKFKTIPKTNAIGFKMK